MKINTKFLLCFFLFFVLRVYSFDCSVFYKIMSEPTPLWMKEQIDKDLSFVEKELSPDFLEKIYREMGKSCALVRIRSLNGVLSIDRSYFHEVSELIYQGIQKLHFFAPLPDFDLLLSGADTLVGDSNFPLPIFIEAKDKTCNSFILIPDRFALHGYEPQKKQVLEGSLIFPWEVKQKILFFRGSDTGANLENWKECARPKLVALSLKNPKLLDARFVDSLHFKQMLDFAIKQGYISGYVSMREHLFYRYLVDIDGNCASCPRTATLFHSNSVVFKQITNSMQWFYSLLQPYKHFIPFKEDLSDLLDQIEWAKDHDEECKQISLNARFLARDVLSEERIYQYLYRLLEEYSIRQKKMTKE